MPESYQGAALVALHGSWNRSEKDGYKVVALFRGEGDQWIEKDFLTGFLKNDKVIGRPAEIAEDPDGAIYVSDDYGDSWELLSGNLARVDCIAFGGG